ncbi:MAG: hypothetical protein GX162_10580 [Firmicutes bacterium]|nr:hypothetical protein [Bacillota bacterium]
MHKQKIFTAFALALLLAFCGGCQTKRNGVTFRGYDAYAYHGESSAQADYIRFRYAHGVEEFNLVLPPQLPRLVVEFRATVASGRVTFKIINPEGKAIIGGYTDAEGHLKLYHSIRLPSGTYTVRIEYEQARDGEISYTMYGYHR